MVKEEEIVVVWLVCCQDERSMSTWGRDSQLSERRIGFVGDVAAAAVDIVVADIDWSKHWSHHDLGRGFGFAVADIDSNLAVEVAVGEELAAAVEIVDRDNRGPTAAPSHCHILSKVEFHIQRQNEEGEKKEKRRMDLETHSKSSSWQRQTDRTVTQSDRTRSLYQP